MDNITERKAEINSLIKAKNLDEAESKTNALIDEIQSAQNYTIGHDIDLESSDNYYFKLQYIYYDTMTNIDKDYKLVRSYLSDLNYIKGFILAERKEYAEAIKQYNIALDWNPFLMIAYIEILNCYMQINDEYEFYKVFQKAIFAAVLPNEISILYGEYARLLLQNQKFEKAYNILKYAELFAHSDGNTDGINAISSILHMQLLKNASFSTINYIRENNLEYKCSPELLRAYCNTGLSYEQALQDGKDLENKLLNLVYIHSYLYFFKRTDENFEAYNRAIMDYNAYKKDGTIPERIMNNITNL